MLYIVVEVGPVCESLVVIVGSEVCAGVLVEVFDDVPQLWAGELVELDARSGSLDVVVVVFEVGPGVLHGVFVEDVVQPGAWLWFEALIWDVTLDEFVIENGFGVLAGMLVGF